MASPFVFYMAIKQDATSQGAAQQIQQTFNKNVNIGIDVIHYAVVSLLPNTTGPGYVGILLVTTFDGTMQAYAQAFWNSPNIKALLQAASQISLANLPVPQNVAELLTFITENNYAQPTDLFSAYPWTVNQIHTAMPNPKVAAS